MDSVKICFTVFHVHVYAFDDKEYITLHECQLFYVIYYFCVSLFQTRSFHSDSEVELTRLSKGRRWPPTIIGSQIEQYIYKRSSVTFLFFFLPRVLGGLDDVIA